MSATEHEMVMREIRDELREMNAAFAAYLTFLAKSALAADAMTSADPLATLHSIAEAAQRLLDAVEP